MFSKKITGNILGIDIGTEKISFALVKQGGKEEVLMLDSIDLPKSLVVNGEINDALAIGAEIKKYISIKNLKPKAVALSIGSPQVIIRDFKIPQVKKKEIENSIIEEISKTYRGVSESHNISYKITNESKSELKGIVALCPKNIVEDYIKVGYEVGEDLKYIDVNSNTTAKALKCFTNYGKNSGNIVMVDIGLQKSTVNIISNGNLVISRQVPNGGLDLDKLISKEFNISLEDAKKSKEQGYNGMINKESMETYLRSAYNGIEQEIGNTLNFFIQNISKQGINSIVLIGGGSKVSGIDNYFQEIFKIPTVILGESDLNNKKVKNSDMLSMFMPAIGAAIRED